MSDRGWTLSGVITISNPNPAALRAAIERLLGDAELRGRLGAAARADAEERLAWPAATEATIQAYRDALFRGTASTRR